MKKRHIYSILFGIPGLIISIILSMDVFGFTAGFLWLFVFGDIPWPSSGEDLLFIMFALVFLVTCLVCVALGFVIGKHLEHDPVLNKKHMLVSTGGTILLLLMMVFCQFRVGNLGPKSDSVRCSDYCS